tara:strand:- start:355 stop:489 length:135 start_codon:yes stop_codon:yes gene_type:complete
MVSTFDCLAAARLKLDQQQMRGFVKRLWVGRWASRLQESETFLK